MPGKIRVSVVPPLFRSMFRWLETYNGVDLGAEIPVFAKGLKIGKILLTEEMLSDIIEKQKGSEKNKK